MALRQPASRLAVTFSVAGGASPRTGAIRTRSGTLLRQLNGVEPGDGVGAEVARAPDLVEQLRRHRPHGHHAAGPGVLGDHRRAVGVQLGQREADALPVRHLLEEGVVPAAALGAALDDVARHHRAGDGVEVVVGPAEGVQRRARPPGRRRSPGP